MSMSMLMLTIEIQRWHLVGCVIGQWRRAGLRRERGSEIRRRTTHVLLYHSLADKEMTIGILDIRYPSAIL